MREVRTSSLFRKHYKKLKKSGRRDMQKLKDLMTILIDEKKYKDHKLEGKWKGYRECHVEGDWLLIYKIEKLNNKKCITFVASDNHSNLFN